LSVKALVVGAGPAGLSAAMQLASWCEKVVVVDARSRTNTRRTGEHLPPTAITSLANLGFSELLDDPIHTVSSGVGSAWGENVTTDRDYFFSPTGHGINLRRDIFDEALTQHCEQAGVRINFDTRLSSLKKTPNGYHATVRGPTGMAEILSDIVLDASGRNARAARQLGATIKREDKLVGIVAWIQCAKPSEDAGRLYIQSEEDGWWYTVQFSDGLLNATYMTDASSLKQHEQGALGLWRERFPTSGKLAQLAKLGSWPVMSPEKVRVFDASTQTLEKMTSATCLSVGDAAVAFDPLSSWGITKGMLDGFEGAYAMQRQCKGEQLATHHHRSKQYRDFLRYRENRTRIYSAEQRWTEAPFWRTRQVSSELH